MGRKHTEETKRKMSVSKKGSKNPMFGKYGKDNPFYGKCHSEETREKISLNSRSSVHYYGQEIVAQYLCTDDSASKIAKDYKTSRSTILRILKKDNIEIIRKSPSIVTRQKMSDNSAVKGKKRSNEVTSKISDTKRKKSKLYPYADKIIKEYTSTDISAARLAKKYGSDTTSLTRLLRDFGIKIIWKPLTEEHKRLMSETRLGEKGANWLGGISFEPYPLEFNRRLRSRIRERDNNICRICEKTKEENGCNMSVHHIDYNKDNSTPYNLISLCKICHKNTNHNRQMWLLYFNLMERHSEEHCIIL